MADKLVTGLFSDEVLKVMNELLDDFILSDYDEEEIYNELKFINESIRMGLYLLSLEKDFVYLSKRIDRVNKRVNEERKSKFLKSYEDGEVEKFLSVLGKGDKISLLNDLGIDPSLKNRKKCNKKENDYYNIISQSIKESQSDDMRDGIDSFLRYKNNKKA
jgi:hypothetical protein